jgi:ABC-type molybdate transport system, ATPase component
LMDETLSALDFERKQEILPYLERLHDQLEIPMLYVSHSPDEVTRLADTVVVMEQGRVRAQGPVNEIFSQLDLALAQAPEASALIEGVVLSHDDDHALTQLEIPGGRLSVARLDCDIHERVRVRIHARDVSLALDEPRTSSILNILPAVILELREIDQGQVLVKLCPGANEKAPFLARITRQSRDRLRLYEGQQVYAQVKTVALMD